MKVAVCIGSSCQIKGSHHVVEQLEKLIDQYHLKDQVDLMATFCIGKCQQGVCTTVDGEFFSVKPETTREFFDEHILKKLQN